MLHIYGEDLENGANVQHDEAEHNGDDDRFSLDHTGGPQQLVPPLHIPKNRSTGNLTLPVDSPEKARIRFSFDAGAAAAEYDALARSPIMTDHDHGLGRSGLRRIRQHAPPLRAPTLPSASSSRSPSFVLPRSASLTAMFPHGGNFTASHADPALLTFAEDLSRFPSESLHSFSFAHQSEELLHSRQNVFKRSFEFMKDRMGYSASSHAGLASAQARVTGDIETQNMLDLLARAQLVGAGNLPNAGVSFPAGPLTGPAELSSDENVFDKNFAPRTSSPEPLSALPPESEASSSAAENLDLSSVRRPDDNSVTDLDDATATAAAAAAGKYEAAVARLSANELAPTPSTAADASSSVDSSRTPTNESGTTQFTSPPASRHPSLLLRRTLTDTAPMALQQILLDTLAKPYVPGAPEAGAGAAGAAGAAGDVGASRAVGAAAGTVSPRSLSVSAETESDATTAAPTSARQQSLASPISVPGNLASFTHSHPHPTRWVPAAQAIFTTEAKPPWTIIAANDLACLVFGVTKAEVRKMGILEVVQEERRAWLEKKLLRTDLDGISDGGGGGGGGGAEAKPVQPVQPVPKPAGGTFSLLGSRSNGITAKLLSKPNSRAQTPQNSTSGRQSPQSPQNSQTPQRSARRAKTVHSGDPSSPKAGIGSHHKSNKSRGVLLCGDVVPIQKRNGLTGAASLWVKEKRVGLIWVLEEIHEDVATVSVDEDGCVTALTGALGPIWGDDDLKPGIDISKLIPRMPRQGIGAWEGPVDFAEMTTRRYYTCRNCDRIDIPATVEQIRGQPSLRVSSFPHIAGIIVVSTQSLTIKSSNAVFCGALFGHEKPNGLSINQLIPDFERILNVLIEVDNVHLVDGIVVPEHSFRKASAFVALREGRPDAATAFLRPEGLPARHRDGSELKIDVQMRVVKSERQPEIHEETVVEASDEEDDGLETGWSAVTSHPHASAAVPPARTAPRSEMVYALWITYSRHLHATRNNLGVASPLLSGAATPLHQPSPGQTPVHSPFEIAPDSSDGQQTHRASVDRERTAAARSLTRELKDAALPTVSSIPIMTLSRPPSTSPTPPSVDGQPYTSMSPSLPLMSPHAASKAAAAAAAVVMPDVTGTTAPPSSATSRDLSSIAAATTSANNRIYSSPLAAKKMDATTTVTTKAVPSEPHKKTIDDFVILEEMGQGAYGQVKLAKYKLTGRRVVIKYVTKRRILVDTWTRDRRLGTVPLEIHVLDYLRRGGLRHPNIVEMEDFFEDDINYYIEMTPHGLPGMDLFDYIELRTNMEEDECRSIFVQVAAAIHHLHTKALVVHRDIKDENVILDGEGNIKLIDFGSAAYIKSGPFDVFVGTIDYAAPEVLAGRPYRGKEQDVWALGILLYTIIYKENPFYSIDEIMDRDLRVPYVISDDSIDLIRAMLNRDVAQRYTIDQVLQHPWCQTE